MVSGKTSKLFAELNGAKVKFVEDAARLLFAQLNEESRIIDFVSFARTSSLFIRMMRWPCFVVAWMVASGRSSRTSRI